MLTIVQGQLSDVHAPVSVGGIVLCGGRSSRMGRPKLSLPFGDELLLPRVVRILSEVVAPVVVVAAPEQDVPPLSSDVQVLRDDHEGLGPLAGMAVGLEALQGQVEAAYVSSCDVPLLQPAFVRDMIERLTNHDLVIAREENFYHPLAAVYRTRLAAQVRSLLSANRLRPYFLVAEAHSAIVDVAELRQSDPHLDSLLNTNTPEDYARAKARVGLE
ncbi:MAG: molybdenum cofactor guanylyltransferase [Planctomycetaceae bacterium]